MTPRLKLKMTMTNTKNTPLYDLAYLYVTFFLLSEVALFVPKIPPIFRCVLLSPPPPPLLFTIIIDHDLLLLLIHCSLLI